MRSKVLFVLAILVIGLVVPAAMAANPVWEFNYWGSKDGDGGWVGNQGGEQWNTQGEPSDADDPVVTYDGVSYFDIDLHNVEAPRLTKTITAWWWFSIANSVPPSDLESYMKNVQVLPYGTQAPYVVKQVGDFEVIADPENIVETGRSQAKEHFVGNLPQGGFVVKGQWTIYPQPGAEHLRWTLPTGGLAPLNPCEGSRFYVNSQCAAPGLPALALIGIPPFVGALIRRSRKS